MSYISKPPLLNAVDSKPRQVIIQWILKGHARIQDLFSSAQSHVRTVLAMRRLTLVDAELIFPFYILSGHIPVQNSYKHEKYVRETSASKTVEINVTPVLRTLMVRPKLFCRSFSIPPLTDYL